MNTKIATYIQKSDKTIMERSKKIESYQNNQKKRKTPFLLEISIGNDHDKSYSKPYHSAREDI